MNTLQYIYSLDDVITALHVIKAYFILLNINMLSIGLSFEDKILTKNCENVKIFYQKTG